MNDKVYRDIDNFDPKRIEKAWVDETWVDDCLFMNPDSIKYLYLTLQVTKQQLHASNSFLYHSESDATENAQHLVNGMLWNDLDAMSKKLEAVFPSLTELVEDTD